MNLQDKITVKHKLVALDYVTLKLLSWGLDEGDFTSIEEFNESNNFVRNKVMILPYLMVTANGVANRKKLISSTFCNFRVNTEYGYYETEIQKKLNGNTYKSTYVDYSSTDKIEVIETEIQIGDVLAELRSQLNNKSTVEGIDYSIDKVFKAKHRKKVYQISFEELLKNMRKSPILESILKQSYYQNEDVPDVILESEMSVFAPELTHRIFA